MKPSVWPDQHDDMLNQKLFLVFLIISLLIIVDALVIEPYNPVLVKQNFDILEGDQNIKIIFISDIHAGYQTTQYLETVVEKINQQEPDVILLGGDFIDHENELELLAPLKKLQSRYGTYAVLGNHDYGSWMCGGDGWLGDKVEQKLSSLGVDVLRNENRILEIHGEKFAIIGLDEFWMCRNNYQNASMGTDNLPKIILTHNQMGVDQTKVDGRNVVLSGHTHCGQIRIPFITDLYLLPVFGKAGGLYQQGDSSLYVSCGVTSGRIRFLAPPEIDLMDVH
ncbi:3',5'-cyclic adenosine monophosphate phosphodiesterase CpdA [Candidatus Bilamarchaeum dharawalense]|uniref:3',5'-cyclic adenosine monophosphate phosphodiesterase CpdA n=1 Tax=Candidatus Bilamarchaeum dharawalense TaxID=2885759 RepID=A0A5E4LQ66_9ARCH|nr:3',5'-cyclic adenosine monophosphate phosphodiesterase CpdA [Candidatus Bilamarchaeum dharawalense]